MTDQICLSLSSLHPIVYTYLKWAEIPNEGDLKLLVTVEWEQKVGFRVKLYLRALLFDAFQGV